MPIWKLPTDVWENLYRNADRPYQIDKNDELWDKIESIINRAKLDNNKRSGDFELWTGNSVSPNAIIKIQKI